MKKQLHDVIIVGGGPAGLSAALILARCCRDVVVYDGGVTRNWAASEMHGYLTRDSIPPEMFQDLARRDVTRYRNARLVEARVERIMREGSHFAVQLESGEQAHAKKVLLATGVLDELPPLKGVAQFFGRTVLPCPYCDGWEFKDKAIAVYGKGEDGLRLVRAMRGWTEHLVLCTDGPSGLSQEDRKRLASRGVVIEERKIKELQGEEDGRLRSISFESGESLQREALFFDMPCRQQSALAQSLGCEFGDKDAPVSDVITQETNIPGLYVAGNTTKELLLAVMAAAQGAKAATQIHKALLREEFSF